MPASQPQSIPVISQSLGSWQFRIERQPLAPALLTDRYDRAAPRWARITDRFGFNRAYREVFEHFFAQLGQQIRPRPYRVLDVGVGAGAFSLALADAYPGDLQLSTVDLSGEMLAEASARLMQRGVPVTSHRADARALPFASESFDLVIAAHVLEHLPDPVIALREMRRVLRPGGSLVTCITRKSWLGAYIQTKWRTHQVSPAGASKWLTAAGFTPAPSNPKPNGFFRLTSLAAIARKPVGCCNEENTQ